MTVNPLDHSAEGAGEPSLARGGIARWASLDRFETVLRPLGVVRGWAARWTRLGRAISRTSLRNSDLVLIGLAAGAGTLAAVVVVLLSAAVQGLHTLGYDLPYAVRLSAGLLPLDWHRVLLVPSVGGLLVGGLALLIRLRGVTEIIDPVEANALYGGRMSLRDSSYVAALTFLSAGVGASVGMEAAYTQLGSSLGSRLGRLLGLRRDDVRTLVGCGAAGAIAAAFNAPLAGAFYAFELVLGSYTLNMLGPVAAAAMLGAFTARALTGIDPIFVISTAVRVGGWDYLAFMTLGLAAALLSILVMQGVTTIERWFRKRSTPLWLRPAIGGLLVGGIGLIYPQVLGSGHGAIVAGLRSNPTLPLLIGLLGAKIVASAVSLGAGFRGGLFSSSLFLGSLFGTAAGVLILHINAGADIDPIAYTLVGMGSVAAGIVGAPITMILLVLETTGDFSATIGVMVGVITASVAVRHWFGYSFATWRFHLRGLSISSPQDVGWIAELTVGRSMRRDPPIASSSMALEAFRRKFPLGAFKQVFVVEETGKFLGVVDVAEAQSPDITGEENDTAGKLVSGSPAFLLPQQNLKTALNSFRTLAAETLPVVDDADHRVIVGYLTESYALRRYAQALELHRGTADDLGIYSPEEQPTPTARGRRK